MKNEKKKNKFNVQNKKKWLFFVSNFRRKWLPQFRKTSQGKVDKKSAEKILKPTNVEKYTVTTTADDAAPSLSSSKSAGAVGSASNTSQSITTSTHQPTELEPEEEAAFELPPPMKPIQDSQVIINNGPTSSSIAAAEQSPCKRVCINQIENECINNKHFHQILVLYKHKHS